MTENEQSLLLYETALARAQLAVEVQGQTHAIKEAEHATKLAEAMQSIGTMQVAMEAQYQSHSARLNCGGMPARRTRRASDSRIPQQRLAAATTPSPCVKDRIGSSDDPWTNRARVKDDYSQRACPSRPRRPCLAFRTCSRHSTPHPITSIHKCYQAGPHRTGEAKADIAAPHWVQ